MDNDVALGVLEKVEVDTPDTWCSRMVVVAKKDGKPRRTVDLKAINKVSVRQTHSVTIPPGNFCPSWHMAHLPGCMEWFPFHTTEGGG